MKLNTSILKIDLDIIDAPIIKQQIIDWIDSNTCTDMKRLRISDQPNSDGKYEVNASYVYIKVNTKSLTNNLFVWNKITGNFDCSGTSITSLEGAPKEVGICFNCSNNFLLKSLKGAPEYVGYGFNCSYTQITSLEGSPRQINGFFNCSYCYELVSFKGAPEEINGILRCHDTSITSLDDAPKKVQIIKFVND